MPFSCRHKVYIYIFVYFVFFFKDYCWATEYWDKVKENQKENQNLGNKQLDYLFNFMEELAAQEKNKHLNPVFQSSYSLVYHE